MKTALSILGCLLAGLVGQEAVAAEFDTLTVVAHGTGLKEFKKTVTKGETLTIDYRTDPIRLGRKENGRTFSSDVLVIPAFTITLVSDKDVGKTTIEAGQACLLRRRLFLTYRVFVLTP